jgi:hypothetical protein
MSKTQLKKELQQLDKESIINVVLDLYMAKKEARDYLDFFVDPDINKRIENAKDKIAKELMRGRLGYRSKTRISHLRKIVKDVESLQPGAEYVAELMVYTIELAYAIILPRRITPTLTNGLNRFVSDTVTFLDRNGQLSAMLKRLKDADNSLSSRSPLKTSITNALSDCAAHPDISR